MAALMACRSAACSADAVFGSPSFRTGDESAARPAFASSASLKPSSSKQFPRRVRVPKSRLCPINVQLSCSRSEKLLALSTSIKWQRVEHCFFGPTWNFRAQSERRLPFRKAGLVSCAFADGKSAVPEEERKSTESNFHYELARRVVQQIVKLQVLPALVLGLGIMLSLRPGHAWAGSTGQSLSPEGKGLLASAWAGLVAGCLHTLTGPDHLAALAPLCIGRSRIQSAAVGALWGCGHDAGQILFGLAFLLLKDKLHIELIRIWASRVVGLTLMTIGGMGIYESQEPVPVLAKDSGSIQDNVVQEEVRIKINSKNATTFATGVVYGLQPDALLMVLPALALPSKLTGAAFLGMFLLGTVLAMGSYTLFLSSCSNALQKRLPGITKSLTVGSSVIAIFLGLALLVSELFESISFRMFHLQ